jgi:hypothetical protein
LRLLTPPHRRCRRWLSNLAQPRLSALELDEVKDEPQIDDGLSDRQQGALNGVIGRKQQAYLLAMK